MVNFSAMRDFKNKLVFTKLLSFSKKSNGIIAVNFSFLSFNTIAETVTMSHLRKDY